MNGSLLINLTFDGQTKHRSDVEQQLMQGGVDVWEWCIYKLYGLCHKTNIYTIEQLFSYCGKSFFLLFVKLTSLQLDWGNGDVQFRFYTQLWPLHANTFTPPPSTHAKANIKAIPKKDRSLILPTCKGVSHVQFTLIG